MNWQNACPVKLSSIQNCQSKIQQGMTLMPESKINKALNSIDRFAYVFCPLPSAITTKKRGQTAPSILLETQTHLQDTPIKRFDLSVLS